MRKDDVISWLRRDLAGRDSVTTCAACGAPLFEEDEFIAGDDGEPGCWPASGAPKTGKGKPCYSYRVPPERFIEEGEERSRPDAPPWGVFKARISGTPAPSGGQSPVDRYMTPEIEARLRKLGREEP